MREDVRESDEESVEEEVNKEKGLYCCCIPLRFGRYVCGSKCKMSIKKGIMGMCIFSIFTGILCIFALARIEISAIQAWRWIQVIGILPALITLICEFRSTKPRTRAWIGTGYYYWRIIEMISFTIILPFIVIGYREEKGGVGAFLACVFCLILLCLLIYFSYILYSYSNLLFHGEEAVVDHGCGERAPGHESPKRAPRVVKSVGGVAQDIPIYMDPANYAPEGKGVLYEPNKYEGQPNGGDLYEGGIYSRAQDRDETHANYLRGVRCQREVNLGGRGQDGNVDRDRDRDRDGDYGTGDPPQV